MLDAQNAVAAPAAIRREDYRPPEWLVPEISLDFELGAERTIVHAILEVERNGNHAAPLRLETGDGTLSSLTVDGNERSWRSEDGALGMCGGHGASVPAAPIGQLVDTTGAGDLFAAGFLVGQAQGRSLEDSLRMGSIAAAEVIEPHRCKRTSRVDDAAALHLSIEARSIAPLRTARSDMDIRCRYDKSSV